VDKSLATLGPKIAKRIWFSKCFMTSLPSEEAAAGPFLGVKTKVLKEEEEA
jgi:hypothetical protein